MQAFPEMCHNKLPSCPYVHATEAVTSVSTIRALPGLQPPPPATPIALYVTRPHTIYHLFALDGTHVRDHKVSKIRFEIRLTLTVLEKVGEIPRNICLQTPPQLPLLKGGGGVRTLKFKSLKVVKRAYAHFIFLL